MKISAQLVMELRRRTGAQMMQCKKALTATEGDLDLAAERLRVSNLAKDVRPQRPVTEGALGSYIHHGSRLAVMVEVNCETDFVARTDDFKAFIDDLCMHVAALDPLAIDRDGIDPALVQEERDIATEQVPEGKPDAIVQKIVDGRLDKFFRARCLLEQPFVEDDSVTVGELLKTLSAKLGENLVIRRYVRWELGSD